MDFGIAGIAAITVLCYLAGGWCKDFEKINDKFQRFAEPPELFLELSGYLSCRTFQHRM